jgi:hypothetical protein
MRESRTYGSGRGARGNSRPYREVWLLHTSCCCICSPSLMLRVSDAGLTNDATGTGAGVRNPAGKEPAGGRARAVPRSLWLFGHLVWGGRSCDRAGLSWIWRATAAQPVAMVRFRMAVGRATAAAAANRQPVCEAGRGPA